MVGRTYTYNVAAALQGSITIEGETNVYAENDSASIRLAPVKVRPDGEIVARLEQSPGHVELNGASGVLGATSSTVTVAPDGRVLQVENPFGAALLQTGLLGYPGVNQFLPVLPGASPVAWGQGTGWTAAVRQRLPDVDESLSYSMEGRFISTQEPGAPSGYRIEVHMRMPLDLNLDARPGLRAAGVGPVAGSPRVLVSGSADVTMWTNFDRTSGNLETMTSQGLVAMTVRYVDFPSSLGMPSRVSFTGKAFFNIGSKP